MNCEQIILNRLKGVNDNRNGYRCNELNLECKLIGNHSIYSKLFTGFHNVTKLVLAKNGIPSIPDGTLDILVQLTFLDLEYNKLVEVTGKLFQNLEKLKKLKLAHNIIKEVNCNAFKNLRNLDYLGLQHNCLSRISSTLLQNQVILKTLYFSNNKIESIEAGAFDSLTILEKLYINKNYLRSLPVGIFKNLGELRILYLHKNYLTEFDADAFANLKNLKELFLSHNKIKRLVSIFLTNNGNETIEDVTELSVNKNQLKKLHNEFLFKNLKKLEILKLTDNQIEFVHTATFSNLTSLTNLSLGSNWISEIDTEQFAKLLDLSDLDLSRNRLTKINFNCNLPSLKRLYLDQNKIEKFNLSMLTELNELYMFKNNIPSLGQDDFKNLIKLKKLYLFNNKISHIEKNTFMELGKLEELLLSSNQIDELDKDVFEGLNDLIKLYLFNNRLKCVRFTCHPKLRYLYLFGNRIEEIEEGTFVKLDELRILLLNQNSISNMSWLSVESMKKVEILNLAFNQIEHIPENSMVKLKELNLSNNKIQSLDEVSFKNLKSLQELNLSSNLIHKIDILKHVEKHCATIKQVNLHCNELMITGEEKMSSLGKSLQEKIISENTNNNVDIRKLENIFIQSPLDTLNQFEEKIELFMIEESLDYFQYIPNCVRFSEIKCKLKMFSVLTGGTQHSRKEFINLIENQNQYHNFMIQPLQLESSASEPDIRITNHCIFDIVKKQNIDKYRKAINRYLSNTPQITESDQINNDIQNEIGHTSKFNFFDNFEWKLDYFNSENTVLAGEFDERELVALINKIKISKLTNIDQLNKFLRRQLLKKLFFSDLNCLLGLDIIYESEVEAINKLLVDNKMSYRVLKQEISQHETPELVVVNKIRLINLVSRCVVTLDSLCLSEKLKLHFLLLKRDCDLVKININHFYQILLINDFDSLCGNSEILIEELMIMIQSILVNKMRMQVVMTVGNPDLLPAYKSGLMELHHDEVVNQLFLMEYQTRNSKVVKNEIEYWEARRTKSVAKETRDLKQAVHDLKMANQELIDEKASSEYRIEYLQGELKSVYADRDLYKKLHTEHIDEPKMKQIVQIEHPPQQLSEVSVKLNEYINALKLKGDTLTKEDTKTMIKLLQDERKSWSGEAKEIICGSIRNLAVNLYTLSNHYIYELLQNFEDIVYGENVIPKVNIVFDRTFIVFKNNEKGFSVDDVRSICSLSNSQKRLNTHIGHKGIGFKSVFLCTNKPIVISRAWQFQFVVNEDDMLSYITPFYIENEQLPLECRHDFSTTLFYLPFKEQLQTDDEYFNDLQESIDINILLFTNRIEMISIEDRVHNTKKLFRRVFKIESEGNYGTTGGTIRIIDAELYVNDTLRDRYRVFKLTSVQRSDEIVIAFPTLSSNRTSYPIYSIFPIYDLNLKFLISAYWHLVTNRETVNEHSLQNLKLKEKILELILYIFKNDEEIGNSGIKYLPVVDVKADFWWKSFIIGLANTLKPFLEEKFKNKRLHDEQINRLADKEVFEMANLEIITQEGDRTLDEYGIRKVSLPDLLSLLGIEDEGLTKWKMGLGAEWWEELYNLLNAKFKDFRLILNYKIFLISSIRQSIVEEDLDKCFLCTNENLKSICLSHNLILVEFSSAKEKNFLREKMKIQEIDKEKLMEVILKDQRDKNLANEVLLMDLYFIKNNYILYEHLNQEYILCVPTKRGIPVSVEHATMATLFSLDLSSLLLSKEESKHIFDYSIGSLKECLEMEIFLLRLKSTLPEINLNILEERVRLQDEKLALLNPFWLFSETEMMLVKQLFDLIPCEYRQTVIPKLPINIGVKEIKIVHISSFYLENTSLITNNGLLYIDISPAAVEIARLFGIKEKVVNEVDISTGFDYMANSTIEDEMSLPTVPTVPTVPRRHPRFSNFEFKVFSIENDTPEQFDRNQLIETFKERIARIREGTDSRIDLLDTNEDQLKVNQLINFELRMNTGIKAELFFYLHLQDLFKDSLVLEECWVSSLRSRMYNSTLNCDDSAGYDFFVDDTEGLLSGIKQRRCFIEVKGFASKWTGTFHITQNELNEKDRIIASNENETYMIAIVENVADKNRMDVEIIDWAENESRLQVVGVDSYEYRFHNTN